MFMIFLLCPLLWCFCYSLSFTKCFYQLKIPLYDLNWLLYRDPFDYKQNAVAWWVICSRCSKAGKYWQKAYEADCIYRFGLHKSTLEPKSTLQICFAWSYVWQLLGDGHSPRYVCMTLCKGEKKECSFSEEGNAWLDTMNVTKGLLERDLPPEWWIANTILGHFTAGNTGI